MSGNGLRAYFLVGPTASGKTAVAQRIAEEDGFDIVSADSMLVYRGMDIGTAKPSLEEQARVRYWCMDLAEPGTHFNVSRFKDAAVDALSKITSEGKRAIVAGGTGLYVKALTHGLSPTPPALFASHVPGSGNRVADTREAMVASVPELQEILQREAPEVYAAMPDKQNPRRLSRAIEMARTGIKQPLNLWKEQGAGPVLTGLRLPMAQLRIRIEERVRGMYRNGLPEEARALCATGFDNATTAKAAIGYAEAIAHLEGRFTIEEAITQTTRRTYQLARRQMTWFRNQANVDWIDVEIGMDAATIARSIKESWRKHGAAPIIG